MNTGNPSDPPAAPSGPGPFTEEEVALATRGPDGEPELEEVEPAEIEERPAELEPFDQLVAVGNTLPTERVQAVVESLLFVADKPLNLDQLYEATGIDRSALGEALKSLAARRAEGGSGIVLHEVASGWQLRSDPGSSEYVRRFLKVKPQRLTRAAVETLAIIAYRQPVTRPEVEDIRGVDCGAVMKALLDRRLIKILGKKDEVGRPILYGTTEEFLQFFALKDLGALPTLREFQELTQEHQEIVEKETGSAPRPEGTLNDLRDPSFRQELEEAGAASEAALEQLEGAMRVADDRSRAAAELLKPPAPDGGPVVDPQGA